MKKLLSAFLIIVYITMLLPVYSLEETNDKLLFMDFEEGEADFDVYTGEMYYTTEIDEEHGTSYAMSAMSDGLRLEKYIDSPVDEGTVLVSFDIRKTTTDGLFYIRMVNGKYTGFATENLPNMFNTFVMKADRLGCYQGAVYSNWSVHPSALVFELDKWYNVDIWIDFDNRKINYYADGQYVGTSSMGSDFTSFKGLCLVHEKMASGETVIDNLSIEKVDYAKVVEMLERGETVPEELIKAVDIGIKSIEVGNVFTSFDEVVLNISLTNKAGADINADIEYKVCDSSGEIVWTSTVKQNIKKDVSNTYDVKPNLSLYDIYTLYVTVTDENGEVYTKNAEFSVAHTPTLGYKNHRYGMNMHSSRMTGTDVELSLPSFNKMGTGIIREVFSWSGYESIAGVYGFTGKMAEYYEKWFKFTEENNIELYALFSVTNNNYPSDSTKCPTTEEGIKALEEAAYNAALEYKDKIKYWEFGNEPDFARAWELPYETYARALTAFYNGIKRGNPDAVVIGMSVSRANAGWIEKILQAGGLCDAVSAHPYQGQSSPEACLLPENVLYIRNMLDRNGWNDIEIWISEANGSSSRQFFTEQQHGTNLVRHYTTNEAYNYADRIITYQYQTDEKNYADNESWFGVVRGWDVENPYGAKPAYLYVSNYFACTENAKYESIIETDDKSYILKYNKPDGSNVFVMYAGHTINQVALTLGSEKGILRDGYGNPTEIHSIDGVYTFTLTDEPVYFETKATSFELCNTLPITLDTIQTELTNGSTAQFNVTAPVGMKMDISARDEYKITKIGDYSFEALRTSTPEKFEYEERDHIKGITIYRDYVDVVLSKDGLVYAKLPVGINYVEKLVDGEASIRPYSDNNLERWVMDITIKNNSGEEIGGWVNMKTPSVMSEIVAPKRIDKLQPGKEVSYSVNVPVEFSENKTLYSAEFVSDTGEITDIYLGVCARSDFYKEAQAVQIRSLLKSESDTRIDGVIDADEWDGYLINSFDKSQVSYGAQGLVIDGVVEQETFGEEADYGGTEDFSGVFYAKWDEEFLYTAAVVKDDVHHQEEIPVRMYLDDDFFVATQPTTNQRHNIRIEMGLSTNIEEPMMFLNYSSLKWTRATGVIEPEKHGNQLAAVRQDKVTIYEAKIPWKLLHYEKVRKNTNLDLSFNIRDYDKDRDKTYSYGGWYCLVDPK